MNPRQQIILNSLSPPERAQFMDLLDYLNEKATDGKGGYMAEGSVAALLNKQPPRIQAAFKAIDQFAETSRFEPFQPKLSEAERFDELGLDAEAGLTIKAALDTMHVANGLQSRLGTDKDLATEPLSMRDHIDAAFDGHAANDAVDNQLQHELSGAAEHLDRRTAIERTFNVMEKF